jgi:hypothetical protein
VTLPLFSAIDAALAILENDSVNESLKTWLWRSLITAARKIKTGNVFSPFVANVHLLTQ